MPRLLCFIPTPKQNTATQQNTEPPATTATEQKPTQARHSGKHSYDVIRVPPARIVGLQRRPTTVAAAPQSWDTCKRVPPAHSLAPRLLAWARQCHGAAMHLTQNTFTTYHSTSTSDIYTRHGVIRVPPARFWGVTRTHDRCCAPQSWATK